MAAQLGHSSIGETDFLNSADELLTSRLEYLLYTFVYTDLGL